LLVSGVAVVFIFLCLCFCLSVYVYGLWAWGFGAHAALALATHGLRHLGFGSPLRHLGFGSACVCVWVLFPLKRANIAAFRFSLHPHPPAFFAFVGSGLLFAGSESVCGLFRRRGAVLSRVIDQLRVRTRCAWNLDATRAPFAHMVWALRTVVGRRPSLDQRVLR
jgi:hypothetical protein